ncbi:MAG: BON domain-containing protein [Rhodospirillales bacterium]|nr:BON domain-containing protein [Alphaproteobacteria bacterium]USO04469.1 MAG: BON domain-containing protein [Rhodospirillales bacterium]
MIRKLFPFFLLSLFILPACSPVGLATGAGATIGVSAAKEGGISRALSDTEIQALINDAWLKHDLKMFSKLGTTVTQGRVLITGVVQDPQHRVEAVRLAWQVKGVKQVINEIRVADSEGIKGYVRDSWITTRLRTSLTFDRKVQSINYSIDTVQGVVYLMGFAQGREELEYVIEKASTIPHVKQVVSYVKLVGEQEKMREIRSAPSSEAAPAPDAVESEPLSSE